MAKIRVFHADDHAAFSDKLRGLLEPEVDWVGAVDDANEVLAKAIELSPDVVLLDIGMPGRSGFELLREIRERMPAVRIIMLSVYAEPAYAEEALRIGAHGYVTKSVAASEISLAVREVYRGRTYVSPSLAGDNSVPD